MEQVVEKLGTAGITIMFMWLMVRYFIKETEKKDKQHELLTGKFIEMAEENTASRHSLKEAIEANTQATRISNENLTSLMLKVLKNSDRRR